jgi:hypothetical protein
MQKIFLISLLIGCLSLFIGCAGKVQNTTLASYETTGVTLEGLHQTAASLCDAKIIKGKDCNKMVVIYAKAKGAYVTLGETSIVVAKSADAVQQQVALCKTITSNKCDVTNLNLAYQSALSLYQKVFTDATKLFNDFITLATQFGVVKGGTK